MVSPSQNFSYNADFYYTHIYIICQILVNEFGGIGRIEAAACPPKNRKCPVQNLPRLDGTFSFRVCLYLFNRSAYFLHESENQRIMAAARVMSGGYI